MLTFYYDTKKEPTLYFLKKYIYKYRESAFAAVVRVDKSTLLVVLYLCFYDSLVLVHLLWCVSFFDGFKSHVTSRFRRRGRRHRLETFG